VGLGIVEHHERYDGTGYPHGLAATAISPAGRIVGLIDAYETMTASRTYKKAMTTRAAREELAQCAGSHFDPAYVRAFLAVSLPRVLWAMGPLALVLQLPFLRSLGEAGARAGAVSGQATALAGSGAVAAAGVTGVLLTAPPVELPAPSQAVAASSVQPPPAALGTPPRSRRRPCARAARTRVLPGQDPGEPSTPWRAGPGGAAGSAGGAGRSRRPAGLEGRLPRGRPTRRPDAGRDWSAACPRVRLSGGSATPPTARPAASPPGEPADRPPAPPPPTTGPARTDHARHTAADDRRGGRCRSPHRPPRRPCRPWLDAPTGTLREAAVELRFTSATVRRASSARSTARGWQPCSSPQRYAGPRRRRARRARAVR
jgi:hypothetical protein